MEKLYTICIFTENSLGLLNRISGIFTRRRINIESLSVSETERQGISRFTIVIRSEHESVEKIVKQIRKIIEVMAVFGYEDEDLAYNEIAFFKVEAAYATQIKYLVDSSSMVRIIHQDNQCIVVEKAGNEEAIYAFFNELKPLGIIEFVRSGRVAVPKTPKGLAHYLPEGEWAYHI